MSARRIAVIGLGDFGMATVELFHERSSEGVSLEIIAIDKNQELTARAEEHTSKSWTLDATNKISLENALKDVDSVAVCVQDIEATFIIIDMLKELEIPEIIVRAHSREMQKAYKRYGVEAVVPEREAAFALVDRLIRPGVREHKQIFPGMAFAKVDVPSSWVEKKISQLGLDDESVGLIFSLLRPIPLREGEDEEDQSYHPIHGLGLPRKQLRENDVLVILGDEEAIKHFEEAVGRLTDTNDT